jgi:L-lactate dehydrogenase (cytochrome)
MIVTIEDLRRRARNRLPRAVFDYIDGGAEDEVTLRANRQAFERVAFRPRALVDSGTPDLSTTVLGQHIGCPIILAPAGLVGLFWPNGEIAAARAAARFGTIFSLSTVSVASLEEVAASGTGAGLWYQLYIFRDRGLTRSMVERALAAGYQALCVTIDVQVAGARERDVRNGFTVPPRITLANLADAVRHVGFLREVLMGPPITFRNVSRHATSRTEAVSVAGYVNQQFDPTLTWADIDWLRSIWPRPLLLKGIMTAADARLAVEHGVDGIVVSNHGGRQLDSLPATLDVLPEIADAVGGDLEILLDSGIRRGSDVAKALALGARACLIGRPYLYGLASAGRAGAELALGMLVKELERTLVLLGRPSAAALDRSVIWMPRDAYLPAPVRRESPS